MNNAAFGIEHPLVTVADMAAVAARYEALGFDPTPLGRHPWGTINRLVMFSDNFIELISVGDASLIEKDPVGGHKFGRRVRDFLEGGDGLSLTALHSKNCVADETAAVARGAASDGLVDFRRAVTLPDGTKDEAVVTLAILPDEQRPNLSVFLCHQHKPHLVWNADWLKHRNGADAITSVTWFAPDPLRHAGRFFQVWGDVALVPHGIRSRTAGGEALLLTEAGVDARFPGMALPDAARGRSPCGVAISVRTADLSAARRFVRQACPEAVEHAGRLLIPASFAGGVVLDIHG
jgi:Glyoxalase-like domain